MAEGTETRPLDSIITIDGKQYSVHAETAKNATTADTAKKVENKLTINTGTETVVFDGSTAQTVTITAGEGGTSDTATKIQVTMKNGTANAAITIKDEDPSNGNVGDIWFKY